MKLEKGYSPTSFVPQLLAGLFLVCLPLCSLSQQNSVLKDPKMDKEARRLLDVDTDNLPEQVDAWVDSLDLKPWNKEWQYLMLYKADAFIVLGEYSSVYKLCQLVDEKARQYNTSESHMNYWRHQIMGRYFLLIDERGKGLKELTQAIKIADKADNVEDRILGRVAFAEALRPTIKKEQAADYLIVAERLAKKYRPDLLAYIYDRWAATSVVYSQMADYTELALNHVDPNDNKRLYGAILMQAAVQAEGSSAEQDSLFDLAADQFRAIGDRRNLALYHYNKSRFAFYIRDLDKALLYVDSSEYVIGDNQWPNEHRINNIMRLDVYRLKGINDSIIKYQDILIQDNRDNANKKELDRLYFLESQFQEEQQKIELREQKLIIEQAEARNRWFIGLLILGVVFIVGMSYFLLRMRRQKKQIEDKNQEIEVINKDLSATLDENVVLLNETHHRVKNNLQVISSLLESQIASADDPQVEIAIAGAKSRIGTMAFVHDLLYRQEDHANLDIGNYLTQLAEQVAIFHRDADDLAVDVESGNIMLPLRKAIYIGIFTNELLTNSHKYARIGTDILRLKIRLYEVDDEYVLEYADNGPGLPNGLDSDRKGSIGMYVLKSMSRQLRGKLTYETGQGAHFSLRFKK